MENSLLPVFVYGTLKKGKYFHNSYLRDSKFLGESHISKYYSLYVHKYPILVKQKSDHRVKGELYKVTPEVLTKLDYLEGHPSYYERKKVKVFINNEKDEIEAWAYIFPKEGLDFSGMEKIYDFI